jgi:glycosyltransferase involved in cell wall biosynthesis
MKIAIVADTKLAETIEFIVPLADMDGVQQVDVICDIPSIAHKKINYITPFILRNPILKNICKLYLLLNSRNDYDFIWGIYELPHGLIAYIGSIIKNTKFILSIIGNPKYVKRSKGLWKIVLYHLMEKSNIVTVTGSNSRKYLIEKGVDNNRLFILPNSVTITQHKSIAKLYDIISIGRLSSEKELHVFLEVISRIKLKHSEVKVAIAGKGPERRKIKSIIESQGLTDTVSLLGYVKDKHKFYQQGRIFLITSSTEGLPRTIIEAQLNGVICIAPNVGDIVDVIEDTHTGFLVDSYDNIEKYVEIISSILIDRFNENEIKISAIKHANQQYSFRSAQLFWDNVIREKILC